MTDHFIEFFEYNMWANGRLLAAIGANNIEDNRIFQLFSHIVSAQLIWLHRVVDLPTSPFPVWEVYKLSELESMAEESNTRWIDLLDSTKIKTFKEVIRYKNSEGKELESTIRDILNHILNHSTHHRGQIMLLLREKGIPPPLLDYIAYKRIS